VTGQRLLVSPAADGDAVRSALMEALGEAAEDLSCWSAHVLFCTEGEREALGRGGLLERITHQYHWHNREEWSSFDDFLGSLRSRPRKEIRRERRLARESGLSFEWRRGEDIKEHHWEAMWRFYSDTTGRKHGMPYLSERFFREACPALGDRALLAMALDGDEPIAASLFFEKGDRLVGRHWGHRGAPAFVHFELCYYMPIERCLERGLLSFEAGAQGEHKIKRGLLPRATHSASWFRVPGLNEAVGRYLEQERASAAQEMDWLAEHSPFRRD
jgi:predicted N-acyltransferase